MRKQRNGCQYWVPILGANIGFCWGGSPQIPAEHLYKPSGAQMKLDLMKQYMFALVLENNLQNDYMTEKVFQSLTIACAHL
jgi:hypothetical protein